MIYSAVKNQNSFYLEHHGILGQKWGTRNGPPYPLSGGDYSPEERKHLTGPKSRSNSIYNKKHYDKKIVRGSTISTVTRNPYRVKEADMFYGAYKFSDRHQYNGLFNSKAEEPLFDDDGNEIGTGKFFKYRVDSKVVKNMKVASEDSGVNAFSDLYKTNRDFYNFVNDKNRLRKAFEEARSGRYQLKAYKEGLEVLDRMDRGDKISYEDLGVIYRLFNYIIPYESNDYRLTNDVKTQRAKFFSKLKSRGYSAVLDTNDAIYNHFGVDAPVIVFDMNAVIPSDAVRTTVGSVYYSRLITAGRKVLAL